MKVNKIHSRKAIKQLGKELQKLEYIEDVTPDLVFQLANVYAECSVSMIRLQKPNIEPLEAVQNSREAFLNLFDDIILELKTF